MRNTGMYLAALLAGVLLAGCSHESADWKSASTADTSDAYEQFLKAHPSSAHAAAADARLKALQEDHDWQAAAAADTREAYEQFIAQHADSKWTQEARIRIENFAQGGNPGGSSAGSVAKASSAAAGGSSESNPPQPPADKIAPAVKHAAKPVAKAAATAATKPAAKLATTPKARPATASGVNHLANAPGEARHYVQLGAFSTKERAQSEWKQLSARFPSELKSLKPDYVAGSSKHGTVYRLRVPVSSVAAGKGLCGTLQKHSQKCVAVAA
jgi:hypothetical protein